MQGNQRAAIGLGVASLGLFLIILFHLGARGAINRGLQASLEMVYLVGLLGATYALWTLRPGGVRRIAYALVLSALAATVFAAYLFGTFPLGFFFEEPLNLLAVPLSIAALWLTVHSTWLWSQDEDDGSAVARARLGLGLLAATELLSMTTDLIGGLTAVVHASLMLIAGYAVAAMYLNPIKPATTQARPAQRAQATKL